MGREGDEGTLSLGGRGRFCRMRPLCASTVIQFRILRIHVAPPITVPKLFGESCVHGFVVFTCKIAECVYTVHKKIRLRRSLNPCLLGHKLSLRGYPRGPSITYVRAGDEVGSKRELVKQVASN